MAKPKWDYFDLPKVSVERAAQLFFFWSLVFLALLILYYAITA